jgi:hypothetical protein
MGTGSALSADRHRSRARDVRTAGTGGGKSMIRNLGRMVCLLLAVASLLAIATAPAGAQATGTVAGSVRDAQGGVMPGATVTLVSQSRGTSITGVTNATGDFVVPNVPGDTYTVRISMSGFKTVERRDVAVSPGDRVVVGNIVIEVGGVAETVTVGAEAPMIQAQTGERSYTVTAESVQNLPINSRNWSALTGLTPGVVGSVRLGSPGANNNNVMLDGVAIMDTGNNGQMLQTNVDAIAEIKILTSGYQAEYGRASGMQITAVTKSGSNQFHGSVYDLERNSDWNANSWTNVQNGDPKAVSKQRDWGYTIGGPAGRPGGANKLFFFYDHEYRPRESGGNIRRFRVPTVLERQGDFSQSTDNTGAPFTRIRDASTGLPCTPANTSGCFQADGVLGRIPQHRLYPIGLNILRLWPEPNTQGLNYNYENTAPTDKRLTQQPTVRVDYQASASLRVTAKYTGQLATVKPTVGTIPGFNDTLNKFPFIYQPSATVNYTLSPTLFIEGTYGFIQNQLGTPIISPASNRCNVGLCDIPLLFPDAGAVDSRYYNPTVLEAIGSPMYVGGRIMLPPTFSFGSRIANQPPSLIYPAFLNKNRTHNVGVSATKLVGRHTLKAGFYWFNALKNENLGISGAIPFNGALNFGQDANNPFDTGFGYANAALGVFSEFSQQSKFVEGAYRYNNTEWYLQDNWRVNNRLTFDYGLRFTHQQPQHDSLLQASNFFLDRWNRSEAPLLYVPGCSLNQSPCPSASRVAVHPVTGASLGPGTAVAIGTLVANSGNPVNGVVQAGQGIAKENYTWPSTGVAPRIGAAYDLTGTQGMVIRGSFGVFYDRPEGNTTSNQIGNPPNSTATTVRWATLDSLQGGLRTQAPAQLVVFKYDSDLPTSLQWNAGIQMVLPWASSLDVSYVGTHGFNLMNPFNQPIDINGIDLGAAFLAQNQDPTLSSAIPGQAALSTDLMRPYRGFGPILLQWGRFWTDFHSIQTSFNRRFRNGLQFGLNHTLTLRQAGTNTLPSNAGVRLVHNADGTYADAPEWPRAEELLGENNGLRRHVIRGNAVWDLPDLTRDSALMNVVGIIVNDWQLSGVLTAGSGTPYDIGYAYQNGGTSVNLTGTPNYAARIRIVGDTGRGCSDNQYAQFNVDAFAGPLPGSDGLESGRNYLTGCFDKTVDLAIQRNIRIGGGRQVQLRADVFNAFNTVVFSGRQSALQLVSPTDPRVVNNQYNADGTLNQNRLQPRNAGFGAVNAAQAMRSVQLQIRFTF